jgi:hypothetical protein
MVLVEVVLERERDKGQTLLDCGLIINMRVLFGCYSHYAEYLYVAEVLALDVGRHGRSNSNHHQEASRSEIAI